MQCRTLYWHLSLFFGFCHINTVTPELHPWTFEMVTQTVLWPVPLLCRAPCYYKPNDNIYEVCDRPIVDDQLTRPTTDLDKVRHLTASSSHAGDWLPALSITSTNLRLTDGMICVLWDTGLDSERASRHICSCDKDVDARGLYGSSCRRSKTTAACQLNYLA